MQQERHKNLHCKDFFEDFKALRDSGFWLRLPPKTKLGILRLLAEQQNEPLETGRQ